MIKRRAAAAGLPYSTCCHNFRATGITAYLENGATLENAQATAAHQSARTTKLYDRTGNEIPWTTGRGLRYEGTGARTCLRKKRKDY